jgi:enoyl-CoA hydratase
MGFPDYEFIEVQTYDDGEIVRIMLDRPEARNAQNRGLLVELNDAFLLAEADDNVRVVILGGNGPMFSAGHDLGSRKMLEEFLPGPCQHPSRQVNGGTRVGSENIMLQEWHYFFQNTLRWRNLRKITIAQMHGPVYSAGLMLMWACDLIVAAENTEFADVVGTRLGMMGVEYFAHPWEFGPRKAKELLLTGDSMGVDEAMRSAWCRKSSPRKSLPTTPCSSPAASHGHQRWQPSSSRRRSTRPLTRWASPAPSTPASRCTSSTTATGRRSPTASTGSPRRNTAW